MLQSYEVRVSIGMLLVGSWWYWAGIRVVLSATGSVYGDTVWYLVTLAQFSAILVGT